MSSADVDSLARWPEGADAALPFMLARVFPVFSGTIMSIEDWVNEPCRAVFDAFARDTLFELECLPQQLLVIGGGLLGTELGQVFCELGTNVILVHDEASHQSFAILL